MNATSKPDTAGIVASLREIQERQGFTDHEMAGRLAISSATWSRIVNAEYKLAGNTKVGQRLDTGLRILRQEEIDGPRETRALVKTAAIKCVLDAVAVAMFDPRNRLVVFLAPTGGGKTHGVARAIAETYPRRSVLVTGNETWRNNYFAAAADIAGAAGVKRENLSGAAQAQQALIDKLNVERPVVVIDEANHFGPRTLNLLKTILNKTTCVVVVLAIPALWALITRENAEEAAQLRSRTQAKIVLRAQTDNGVSDGKLDKATVRTFLGELIPRSAKLDRFSDIVAACAAAANRFGLFDTLARIVSDVKEQADGGEPDAEMFATAIRNTEALR